MIRTREEKNYGSKKITTFAHSYELRMRQITNGIQKNISVAGMHLAFLFLLPSAIHAQSWVMPVNGRVFANNDILAGSVVTLYKNSAQLKQVVTTSSGEFIFALPPDAEYVITITKPGFITKKLKVNTANVPASLADTAKFTPFQPDVTIFEMPTAPETSKRLEAILSQPLAVYQYIPSQKNFNYDEKYTDMIKARLTELSELQMQAENEMVEKAKAAAVEAQQQMDLDKKYKAAIDKADKAFGKKDYAIAKAGYKEALGLKPEEVYPKQKLLEVEKLLANGSKR